MQFSLCFPSHPSAVFSSRIFICRGYDQPRHLSILQSSFSRPFAAQWRRLIVGRDGEHSSEHVPFLRRFLDPCFSSTAGFVEWRSAGSAILPSLAGRGGGDAAPVSRIILVCSSFSFSRRSSFMRFCTTCCPATLAWPIETVVLEFFGSRCSRMARIRRIKLPKVRSQASLIVPSDAASAWAGNNLLSHATRP